MHTWTARLRQGLLAPLKWLLALLILFEEWGWEPLQRVVAAIGRWPGFRWIEAWVRRLPPYAALALFALPALALLPIKLAALWAIRQGHALLGLTVIVIAKLVGTAIVARLFTLTHDALMRLDWFARIYGRWSRWKAELLAWVHASAAWRAAQALKARLRTLWRR
ncbi:hypothetical protein [Ideonella alba]|uniref:Transmembrane protein n=1 Tax=Ideonella alba TaxID=2824118 RepID=A0A941BF57_9BURK|nr:hypothetical protein [Ideonella alba]MBQ0929058.1 hypothetical protein [Ideonella alba]